MTDPVRRHIDRINGTRPEKPTGNDTDELMQEIRDARDPIKRHIRKLNERAKREKP